MDSMARRSQPVTPTFYLGTHLPHWLTRSKFPLFISHELSASIHRVNEMCVSAGGSRAAVILQVVRACLPN